MQFMQIHAKQGGPETDYLGVAAHHTDEARQRHVGFSTDEADVGSITKLASTNGNPYRIKWWHLTQREHDSECRKEDIGKRTYSFPEGSKHPISFFLRKRRNRSKRKRAYRWKKRIDELDRLANRWDLLQQIKHSVPNADLSLFESLLFDKSVHCEVSKREDYSADGIGLTYIYELMTKYDQRYSKEADLTLLWVQSPHDIDANAMENICTLVSNPAIVQNINPSKYARTRLTIVQLFKQS